MSSGDNRPRDYHLLDNYKVVRVGGDEDVTVISGIGLDTARETAARFNDGAGASAYWYVAVEEGWHRNPIDVAGGWEPEETTQVVPVETLQTTITNSTSTNSTSTNSTSTNSTSTNSTSTNSTNSTNATEEN